MPKGYSIDIDALHAFLYRKADRLGRVKLNQRELADEFGITKFTMSRIISKMVEAKRIKRISNNTNNRGFFSVEDPEVWEVLNQESDNDE